MAECPWCNRTLVEVDNPLRREVRHPRGTEPGTPGGCPGPPADDEDRAEWRRPDDRKIRLLVEVTVPEIHASRTTPRLAAQELQAVLTRETLTERADAFDNLSPWWMTAQITVGAWTHTPEPDEWETAEPIPIPMAGDGPKLVRTDPLDAILRDLPAEAWVKLHTVPVGEPGGARFVLDGRLRMIPMDDPTTIPAGARAELVWTDDGVRLDVIEGDEGDQEGER